METDTRNSDDVRDVVRDTYAKVAENKAGLGACCGPSPDSSLALGYSKEELDAVPEGANMGLGCGNPQAIAALKPGETVVDLGSGGGFDAFLAARQVGSEGRVIGVDMTPEMIRKSRDNARKLGLSHVEFRLGEIEALPIADSSVDVIISNCVINLSPEKGRVFAEAIRVLRPGGRLAISDVVATDEIPASLCTDTALCGCISGAAPVDEISRLLVEAGFVDVRVDLRLESREFIREWLPEAGAEQYVSSAVIEARRPTAEELAREQAGCCEPSCCS